MFRGVNLLREKFFSAFAQVDSGCLHNAIICQPCPLAFFGFSWRFPRAGIVLPVHTICILRSLPAGFLPSRNCVLHPFNFALYGVFLPSGVGFPALRSVLAVVGVSVSAVRGFHLSRRCFCLSSVRVPAVSVCLSFDRFRLAFSAVRFCPFSAFRLARGSLLPFAAFRPFSRLFRLYRVVWAGCFCRPALSFIISPPPCIRQPIPQRSFLPYFAFLLLLWCSMP